MSAQEMWARSHMHGLGACVTFPLMPLLATSSSVGVDARMALTAARAADCAAVSEVNGCWTVPSSSPPCPVVTEVGGATWITVVATDGDVDDADAGDADDGDGGKAVAKESTTAIGHAMVHACTATHTASGRMHGSRHAPEFSKTALCAVDHT
jgi:hypothetical protein